jgi:hypothetical protein
MVRRLAAVVALVVATGPLGAVAYARPAPAAGSSGPTLSVSTQLDNRRFVAAGTRAYDAGTEAGRYYAMGFHTRGEMGGIWTPPIKLLDGIWFGVNGAWLGPATRFTAGYGYTRMDLPGAAGLSVQRTDVVPDGRRGVLVGLSLRGAQTTTVSLTVDTHSELLGAYPWGETNPSQLQYNLPDSAAVRGGRLIFREQGTPPVPNALPHDWAAVVGAAPGSPVSLTGASTGSDFRGPQDPPVICPASGPNAPPQPAQPCDDTAYGKGAGGELRYSLTVPANSTATAWFAVAGSDLGLRAAQSEFAAVAGDPSGELSAKVAARQALAGKTVVSLPGDRTLQHAIDWGKQNLADLTQDVGAPRGQPLEIRETNAGTNYPPPVGTVPRMHFVGAGFVDYPWLFATDGEYTAFASVAVGQFPAIKDHLRALRDVSQIVNHGSGKVVHEVVTDGSVYFGANADPGNTDETVKFPSAVALVWRWTGDNAFRDEMYAFARSNLVYATTVLDADHDGWPEGAGNVERPKQGQEKLDNAVYLIRGMLDFAQMARSKGRGADAAMWESRAHQLAARFELAWWFGGSNVGSPTPGRADAYADSLQDPGDLRVYQRYWTGVTPMEAELWQDQHGVPGLAAARHAGPALDLRETSCFTTPSGMVHTGTGQTTSPNTPQPVPTVNCIGDQATSNVSDERDVFTLNTAVMAVGEGNYGRLGAGQQQAYTDDNARLMFTPDEMPGAMGEIAPSEPHPPYYGQSLERLFTERASVMQAWGNYGTMWPVVHQQLGVRPNLGVGRLEVVPQVPAYATGPIQGSNIRLGGGSIHVLAWHDGSRYQTVVDRAVTARLTIGHTLPAGATVASVTLNGVHVPFAVRDTNRGREVLVTAGSETHDNLVVTAG